MQINLVWLVILVVCCIRSLKCSILEVSRRRSLSVCLLVTIVSPAKTADPIEMPFWGWHMLAHGTMYGVKVGRIHLPPEGVTRRRCAFLQNSLTACLFSSMSKAETHWCRYPDDNDIVVILYGSLSCVSLRMLLWYTHDLGRQWTSGTFEFCWNLVRIVQKWLRCRAFLEQSYPQPGLYVLLEDGLVSLNVNATIDLFSLRKLVP